MRLKNTNTVSRGGFTILEVMIALAIIGISVGIFFGLIGNSSKLRGKIDEHTKFLLLARTKMEESYLGILGKKPTELHEETIEKKNIEGTTNDGIKWEVSEINKRKEALEKIKNMYLSDTDKAMIELPPKGARILSIVVEGINIDTVYFTAESEEDESEMEDNLSE